MRVLIATDAWHPQVNGVVRTLTSLIRAAQGLGVTMDTLTPAGFPSAALTASTAAYGMLSYMLAAETQTWGLQTLSVAGALYIIALIGLAGLYSGLALSAIVGGFALGGCWLAICVTGRRTYIRLRSAGLEAD